MSEKRILLASLLKPVTDTRMYEKLGLSLCRLNNVQVHIAGFSGSVPQLKPANLTLHPIFSFKRLSLDRAKAQLLYWELLQSIKPDLIIVCTHELLLPSILYKSIHTCKIIYDIQENYTLNILSQHHYTSGIKQLLAGGIALTEKIAAKAIDFFLLAERSYAQELSFLNNRFTIIENKFKPEVNFKIPDTPVQLQQENLKLLYTGTIATLYGVFEAVSLADQLQAQFRGVTLTIIGYCASTKVLAELKQAIAGKDYIKLIGGDRLVPHQQILEEIQSSDLGLMPYHYNKSIYNCIPTKLYEYAALGLPILIQQNPNWDKLVKAYDAGLSVDFKAIHISSLTHTLLNNKFYRNGQPTGVFWEAEEQKLLPLVAELL